MFNSKAQAGIEFLIVIVVVIVILVAIFVEVPQDTSEIFALGITKNNIDNFVLKSNYSGDYNLSSNVKGKDINIIVEFSLPDYNKQLLDTYLVKAQQEIKANKDFNNVLISAS